MNGGSEGAFFDQYFPDQLLNAIRFLGDLCYLDIRLAKLMAVTEGDWTPEADEM